MFVEFKWMAESNDGKYEWKTEHWDVEDFQDRDKINSAYWDEGNLRGAEWVIEGYNELLQENIWVWVWGR